MNNPFIAGIGLMGATEPGQRVTAENAHWLPPGSVVRLDDGGRLIHLHDDFWLWCDGCIHCYDSLKHQLHLLPGVLCHMPINLPTPEHGMPPPAERPTPITDEMLWQYDHLGPNWLATEILGPFARNLERQLAEAREQRDTAMRRANKIAAEALALTEQRGALAEALEKTAKDFITFRNIARENGIVGTIGLESLELAAAALAAINPDTPS